MDERTLHKLHDAAAMLSMARESVGDRQDLASLLDGASREIMDILEAHQPQIDAGTVQ